MKGGRRRSSVLPLALGFVALTDELIFSLLFLSVVLCRNTFLPESASVSVSTHHSAYTAAAAAAS